ncbi:MAG: release factor glutamine methyltransferase [Candidatus Poribacteria bacterium]|nr:MAG: release factor glutamine methyltransferase [Candidatus Poribacteria bacterium]
MSADPTWTVLALIQWTSEFFSRKGIESARLDAELLLAHALGRDRMWLYLHYDTPVGEPVRGRFRELVRRRAERVPVAYLTGEREFYALPFWVTPSVLIPRPETERLVEVVLGELIPLQGAEPLRLVDVGTGSGVLAVVLAKELGERLERIVATDRSPEALQVAQKNAIRHGVAEWIEFREGDLLAALAPEERVHGILSNPPYVPSSELASLQPEVRHEPREALDGGPDGLEVVRRLVRQAPERLCPGGWIALEVGAGQAPEVLALLEKEGFSSLRAFEDYSGVPRVVVGFWKEGD